MGVDRHVAEPDAIDELRLAISVAVGEVTVVVGSTATFTSRKGARERKMLMTDTLARMISGLIALSVS